MLFLSKHVSAFRSVVECRCEILGLHIYFQCTKNDLNSEYHGKVTKKYSLKNVVTTSYNIYKKLTLKKLLQFYLNFTHFIETAV